jgi:hypothetical protein
MTNGNKPDVTSLNKGPQGVHGQAHITAEAKDVLVCVLMYRIETKGMPNLRKARDGGF